MKQILLLTFCNILLSAVKSQPTISPSQNNEYCPGVEYTFTVTIPKPYQGMIAIGGCTITQYPFSPVGSTFTFKGKFGDFNQKQIFRVYYEDGTHYDFEFKKIKSLWGVVSCAKIPNQGPITAPRCQIVNIPISVNDVQWGNVYEDPVTCYGSISDFEYQLPVGWSIGATTSTGNNWIPGDNNVTITSDMSNGVNGVILIRPRNTCGAGLQNGQFPGLIPISRPAPSLSITGSQYTICSGCKSFQINGMPAGATVQWGISGSDASISGSSTSPTVSICRNTSANTVATLTATVTHCTFTYTVTRQISLGMPSFIGTYYFSGTYPTISTWNSFGGTGAAFVDLDATLNYSSYYWTLYSGTVTNWTQYNSWPYGKRLDFDIGPNPQDGDQFAFQLAATNECGTLNEVYYFYYSWSYGYRISVFPNPASQTIKIEHSKSDKITAAGLSVHEVQIVDKMGTLRLRKIFGKGQTSVSISIDQLPNDVYTLRVFNGKEWTSQKIIIKH